VELMRQVRELARRMEFLEAGQKPGEKMDSTLVQVEVNRLYLMWGLVGVTGLEVDGAAATPAALAESGPEDLFREALAAVKAETGLNGAERKN
jgi:ABC-type enterobactin transport system permease subunit